MTPQDAAGLALLNLHNRRLVAALIRVDAGRGTIEDIEALATREAGEPLLTWACRASARPGDPPLPTRHQRLVAEASRQLAAGTALGVAALPLGDARYPPLLAEIPDPPPLLWVRGQAPALQGPGVAVVGSRAATPYGLAMAKEIARDLAAAGVVVVSGLARGIDSAAHAASLSSRHGTVGVLGCGIDRIYPAEHRDLAREMETAGAVVSEFPPGVPPLPHHFPLRNRIISGLSLAVVVVEAREKSGALITVAAATEQGRGVMVVPGPAAGGRHRGGHRLIQDGATLVEGAPDILRELERAWPGAGGRPGDGGCERPDGAAAGPLPEAVDFTVDEVATMTGEPAQAVLARLLELELMGRIQRIGGGRFARVLT